MNGFFLCSMVSAQTETSNKFIHSPVQNVLRICHVPGTGLAAMNRDEQDTSPALNRVPSIIGKKGKAGNQINCSAAGRSATSEDRVSLDKRVS